MFNISCFSCQMSGGRCQVSGIRCQMSGARCQLSTATATDPPPADSPTMYSRHSPPSLLQMHTRIIVHAQTAAQQQPNGSYEARMSQKCGEWRD